jgi:hypothetical protein
VNVILPLAGRVDAQRAAGGGEVVLAVSTFASWWLGHSRDHVFGDIDGVRISRLADEGKARDRWLTKACEIIERRHVKR